MPWAAPHFDARQNASEERRLLMREAADLASAQAAARAAAVAGDAQTLASLLRDWPRAASARFPGGESLLMAAAEAQAPDAILGMLGAAGAGERDDKGRTALMRAAFRFRSIGGLLRWSDALAVDGEGRTALMWAAAAGNASAVEILAPISAPLAFSEAGFSALMFAASGGSEGHARCALFLAPVSDARARNKAGLSASQIALRHGAAELAAALADQESD